MIFPGAFLWRLATADRPADTGGMAAVDAATLRQPYAGTCPATIGRTRGVTLPGEAQGVWIQQAGATAGTLYVTQASSRGGTAFVDDDAAGATLNQTHDVFVILPGGSLSLPLGPAQEADKTVWVASDTASATFKVAPVGLEALR